MSAFPSGVFRPMMFKMKIDAVGLESHHTCSYFLFLPLLFCLFSLSSLVLLSPALTVCKQVPVLLSLPLAQTSCDRVEPGYPVSQPSSSPSTVSPRTAQPYPLDAGPCQGLPQGEGPPGDLGSLRPVSHCLLSFSGGDDVGPEACGKMGGGFRRKNPGLGVQAIILVG